jgi:hypothetical protein
MHTHELRAMVDRLVADQVLPADRAEAALSSLRHCWTDRIALIWTVEDVLTVCPKLTQEQAADVLYKALEDHDASVGVDWDTLRMCAQVLDFDATDDDEEEGDDDAGDP